MDEGVKASVTRQTMQKSPKATNLESQYTISKAKKFDIEELSQPTAISQKQQSKKKENIEINE